MFYVLLPKMLFLFRYPDAFFLLEHLFHHGQAGGQWDLAMYLLEEAKAIGMGKCWPLDKQWAVFDLIKPYISGGRLGGWVDQP